MLIPFLSKSQWCHGIFIFRKWRLFSMIRTPAVTGPTHTLPKAKWLSLHRNAYILFWNSSSFLTASSRSCLILSHWNEKEKDVKFMVKRNVDKARSKNKLTAATLFLSLSDTIPLGGWRIRSAAKSVCHSHRGCQLSFLQAPRPCSSQVTDSSSREAW